uniref:DinB family protein n=1 Tax=Roseivirga sp. TaxID=1964215 RepID=UPI0040471B89
MIALPELGEYNPFYQPYIDQLKGVDILLKLSSQKVEIADLLKSIGEEKANYAYAEGKWTIKEVLNHINDVERIFAYRALAIARGDLQSLPGMDQDNYQLNAKKNLRSFDSLINEFIAIRESSIHFFNNISEEESLKIGTASNNPVSVRALAGMVVGHAAHHVMILKERYL